MCCGLSVYARVSQEGQSEKENRHETNERDLSWRRMFLGYKTFPETNRRCGGYPVGYANGNIANPTYQQVLYRYHGLCRTS